MVHLLKMLKLENATNNYMWLTFWGMNLDSYLKLLKKHTNLHNANKILLIPNSRDIYPESERKTNGINNDILLLKQIGFDVKILSLKDYFGKVMEMYLFNK